MSSKIVFENKKSMQEIVIKITETGTLLDIFVSVFFCNLKFWLWFFK